jgi:hypothetical protein
LLLIPQLLKGSQEKGFLLPEKAGYPEVRVIFRFDAHDLRFPIALLLKNL